MDDGPFNTMSVVVQALGLALAAFAVWLTVRIINRRERWALWTAAALALMLVCCAVCLAPGSGINGIYKHDWTVHVNGYAFGIDQFDSYISERLDFDLTEPTSIHLGLTSVRTSFSAYQVLGIGVGALLLVAVVALVITRVGRPGKTP